MASMALGVLLYNPGKLTVTSGYLLLSVVSLHPPHPPPFPSNVGTVMSFFFRPSLRLIGRPAAAAVAEAGVL